MKKQVLSFAVSAAIAAALCANAQAEEAAAATTEAAAAATETPAVQQWKPTFDFHGYFRAGVGMSRDDANMEWSKSMLGRLGNERDTYGELEFGSEIYKIDDVSFYLDSMVSLVSDGQKDDEGTSDDAANFGLRQFNLQIKGLIPGDKNAVIWGGKRYYQRKDIHIIDTKYLNISGPGAGIENLSAGPGAFSFAWIRADSNDVDYRYDDGFEEDVQHKSTTNVNYGDIRYTGFRPWAGAWTDFVVDVAVPSDPDSPAIVGWKADGTPQYVPGYDEQSTVYDNDTSVMLTAELSQDMFGGYNKTVLQYANNGLAHNMVDMGGGWYDSWNDADGAYGFRIINTGDISLTDNFSVTHVLTYGYAKDTQQNSNIDDIQLFQAAARTSYQLTKYVRWLNEVGMFIQDSEGKNGADDELVRGQKYTTAIAIAPGKEILSRPELRLYATYLHCSDGKLISNSQYNGEDMYEDNFNVGVQVEAWW